MKRKEIYHPPELLLMQMSICNVLSSMSYPISADPDAGFDLVPDGGEWLDD